VLVLLPSTSADAQGAGKRARRTLERPRESATVRAESHTVRTCRLVVLRRGEMAWPGRVLRDRSGELDLDAPELHNLEKSLPSRQDFALAAVGVSVGRVSRANPSRQQRVSGSTRRRDWTKHGDPGGARQSSGFKTVSCEEIIDEGTFCLW